MSYVFCVFFFVCVFIFLMEESGRKTQTEGWPLQMKYSAAAADLWADQGGVQPGFRKHSGQKPSQPALCRRADAMRRGSFTPERCHVSSLLTPKDPAESSMISCVQQQDLKHPQLLSKRAGKRCTTSQLRVPETLKACRTLCEASPEFAVPEVGGGAPFSPHSHEFPLKRNFNTSQSRGTSELLWSHLF
ncbi:uncharacterized protein ACNS7B_023242 isoform 1-T2 [Menidia menidia]